MSLNCSTLGSGEPILYPDTDILIRPSPGSMRSLAMGKDCCGCGNDGFDASACSTGSVPAAPVVQVQEAVCLTALKAGQTAMVCQTSLDPSDAALLRAMGLRPLARIRVCRL